MTLRLVLVTVALSILLCGSAFELALQQHATTAGILQCPTGLGASLDVATQKGGEGSFNRSDAFGPHETLVLTAKVAFSGWPEQNKDVAFEMVFPNGTSYAVLYDRTDEEGIARISCQLPAPGNDTEQNGVFGNWTIWASADVAGSVVKDAVAFEYGWLVGITSIQTGWNLCEEFVPEGAFCRHDSLGLKVKVKTLVCDPLNVTLSLTALDALGVPFLSGWWNYTAARRTTEVVFVTLGAVSESGVAGKGAILAVALAAFPQQGARLCPTARIEFLLRQTRVAVAVPADYPTIQAALLGSHCGAVVLVSPGVYHEHLSIRKPVFLVGRGPGDIVVDGDGEGDGLDVGSPYVSIVGLTVRNCSIGLRFRHTAHNTVYHNNFVDNRQNLLLCVACNACSHSTFALDNGCEGNFWGTYNGTDLNGDGVGDTCLPWYGVDSYPLMGWYWQPGDIDHDLDIDIFDVVKAGVAYGTTPSDPWWNPHCDIAEAYGRIDLYDIVMIAASYGEKYDP